MPSYKLIDTSFTKFPLWPDSEVLVIRDKKPQLIRQIEICLIVGSGRKQDYTTVVRVDIFGNCSIAFALAVPQIVTLVNQDQAVPPQVW